jgi:Fe-S cluster assembly iron-binding protein IscA
MGFTSQDDLINEISTNGKYVRRDGSKLLTPAHTAGGWHLLMGMGGYPNASTYPGTDLVWSNTDEFTGDGTTITGMQHNGAVTPDTKHILNVGAMIVAAAGAPWQLKLVDVQGYYRLSTTNVTGTGSRVLINSNTFTASSSSGLLLTYTNDFKSGTKVQFTTSGTLPTGLSLATDYWLIRVSATTARVAASYTDYVAGTAIAFTDAGTGTHTFTIRMPRANNGVGCEAAFVVQTQPTAGGPTLSASSYTNSAGTAGRAFQGTPTMGATADAYAGRVLHSGNAAGRYGPFLPRQGADTGISSIQSFTWSGGTAYTGTGVVALVIVNAICDIPLPATGVWSERDLVNQLMSLPKIEDGANLQWMVFSTGATTANSPLNFAIDFAWG